MNTFYKIIFLTITSIIIIIFIFCSLLYYSLSRGKQWIVREWEKFCLNKEYSIWKAYHDNLTYFCDNKNIWRCLKWINLYKVYENDLYLYFENDDFIWKTSEEINNILKVDNPKWFIYNIFNWDYSDSNKYYAKTYDDIKFFLKLNYNDCSLNFYSNKEIENLNEEDKKNFLDLKNNK
jgi:hypothetical protein